MDIYLPLVAILTASLCANALLVYLFRTSKRRRPLSISAEELLGDLARGQAVIRIERIAPSDIFLRSPRS